MKTDNSSTMYVGAGWSETGNKNTKPGVWRALGAGALFAVAAFCLANAVQSTLHDGASSAGALLRLSSAPPRAQTKGTGVLEILRTRTHIASLRPHTHINPS
jgi:hypothetical protein